MMDGASRARLAVRFPQVRIRKWTETVLSSPVYGLLLASSAQKGVGVLASGCMGGRYCMGGPFGDERAQHPASDAGVASLQMPPSQ